MRPPKIKSSLLRRASALAQDDALLSALDATRVSAPAPATTFRRMAEVVLNALATPEQATGILAATDARLAVAQRLAAHVEQLSRNRVLAACALLDLGKPLVCGDGVYLPVLDAPGPAAAAALEQETNATGIDHALAAKWLAELWNFAPSITEAVWLHHHSLATIDAAAEQPALCLLVQLVDALAQGRQGGEAPRATPLIEELCARLGIRPKEALGAARAESVAPEPELAVASRQSMEQRYRALLTTHGALHAARVPADALLAVCNAMRDAFGCPRGACAAGNDVAAWDAGPAALVEGELPTPPATGIVVLPMTHQGAACGQLWASLPEHAASVDAIAEMTQFLATSGAVLARLEGEQRVQAQGEAMATALHRVEAERQRSRQTEHLAGLARFAAGAAHEINNPLAVISGRAQLLLSRTAEAEQARALDAIIQQSQRIGKIVGDLMQFARPPEPRWALVDVAETVRTALAPVRERLAPKRIVLAEHYSESLPRVRMDRHQIDQAISQVFLNAEQALEARGGGRIEVSVRLASNHAAVEISIRDNGPGISADNLDRVFDPFFTTKQFNDGSTGLGLTVCRGIVQAHHGRVRVQSRAGDGTTVTITLPAAADGARTAPAAAAAPVTSAPETRTAAREDVIDVAVPASGTAALELEPWQPVAHAPAASEDAITREAAAEAEAIVERVFPRPVPTRAAAAPPPIVRTQGSILVIEENEDLREVLRAALAARGFATEAVPDGLEGLASVLASPPDLVLCATQLSGVDALTLIRQVRQRFGTLPILAMAGPGTDENGPEALRAGARALLHKPFDFDRLLQEVNQFLSARNVA